MKLTVCGVPIEFTGTINVLVRTDDAGEVMPPVNVQVLGGPLQVNRSALTTSGPISVHPFREEEVR